MNEENNIKTLDYNSFNIKMSFNIKKKKQSEHCRKDNFRQIFSLDGINLNVHLFDIHLLQRNSTIMKITPLKWKISYDERR